MVKSKIEWCDSTFNPVTGCKHDCEYCYARGIANRFKGCDESPNGETSKNIVELKEPIFKTCKDGIKRSAEYPFGFTPTFHEYRLKETFEKGYGKTIFVGSTSDIFGKWVPDEWIVKVFRVCEKAKDKRFIFLTKNPERYIELFNKGLLPDNDNFWFGSTSTNENVEFFWSDKHNTFVSFEPVLGPFSADRCHNFEFIDWIIIGAETGSRKNKVVPEKEWIENIVKKAREAGKPVFMKDSLKPIWGEEIITEFPWD